MRPIHAIGFLDLYVLILKIIIMMIIQKQTGTSANSGNCGPD